MDILFRDEQVAIISKRLNIAKSDVNLILGNYVLYLQEKVDNSETVKILNICYLKNTESGVKNKETLGYIATEIANSTSMGRATVLRVLTTLEELIIQDLQKGKGFCIRGLIRIRRIEEKGSKKVRIKKSVKYNGEPVYIVTLNSFKRRVGVLNAG